MNKADVPTMQQPDYFIDENGLPNILNREKTQPKRRYLDNVKSSHHRKHCDKLLNKREHACHNKTISVINNVKDVEQIQPCLDKSTKDIINQRLKDSYCAIGDN